ncbi:MAG: archaeosortase [Thermoplasmata archaeon]|jgi:exosortase/archaeosortase family protein|nr:archaeosortase [Thermoplasmata archaeon]
MEEAAPTESPLPGAGAKGKPVRVHPYALELSTAAELRRDPRMVTLFWAGLGTALVLLGLGLANRFSPCLNGVGPEPCATPAAWTSWVQLPLFGGLALLGFGFVQRQWARRVTLAGWLLFGFYWALTAQDLFVAEGGDIVNLCFAIVGVYFFVYLAYHQWLSEARGIENLTVRFLNIATFVAAGSYFVIDKIEPVRKWLILTVSRHTEWMLGLFGQGADAGLRAVYNPAGSTSDFQADLARFYYEGHLNHCPSQPSDWFSSLMHWDPFARQALDACRDFSAHEAVIVPVSIILACTALQSIMLFVGLFMGTPAPWKRRLLASAIVAAVVYVLNLLRNTGIVWFYGQGEASFWMMHDAVGKGGSLVAMILIAFAAFAWFPEFLKALVGVLDLPHRDGPIERTLRLGRRRPDQGAPPAEPPAETPAPPVH